MVYTSPAFRLGLHLPCRIGRSGAPSGPGLGRSRRAAKLFIGCCPAVPPLLRPCCPAVAHCTPDVQSRIPCLQWPFPGSQGRFGALRPGAARLVVRLEPSGRAAAAGGGRVCGAGAGRLKHNARSRGPRATPGARFVKDPPLPLPEKFCAHGVGSQKNITKWSGMGCGDGGRVLVASGGRVFWMGLMGMCRLLLRIGRRGQRVRLSW